MANFDCGNISKMHGKLFISRAKPGPDPSPADFELVEKWLGQLMQENLEIEGDLDSDLIIFAAKERGEIDEKGISDLLRAKRRHFLDRFSRAIRECRL